MKPGTDMNSTLRSLAVVLASLPLLATLPTAQGQPGGVGGTYTGPGDTVPQPTGDTGGPQTPPPTIGGPRDTGLPGSTGQPSGPPLGGGIGRPGQPPPGMPLPIPPDEPTLPDARPPVSDRSSWQLWWHYNRWDHLPVGRAREMLSQSGAGAYFLGRGERLDAPQVLTASETDVRSLVLPALASALQGGGRQELVVYALHAQAKLRDYPVEGSEGDGIWSFESAVQHYLQDGSQEIPEKALLALGIRGEPRHMVWLSDALADNAEGRRRLGRSRVGHRLRAFAAYGLGLMADRNPDAGFRARIYERLVFTLADDRPEVQAAAALSLGLCALPVRGPHAATGIGQDASSSTAHALEDQVAILIEFLDDRDVSTLARSQVPGALAHLSSSAPEPLRISIAGALLRHIGPHATAPYEVRNGAVIALGSVGRAGTAEIDAEIRDALERLITGSGSNRSTRNLATISLAQSLRQPGVGEEPHAGVDGVRRFLLRQMNRSRGQSLAWNALALGILEEGSADRGAMPSADSAAALREELKRSRSGDVVGAVALALGMMRDIEAAPLLRERMEDSGSAVLRGYAALALGMIGDQDSLQAMRELLVASTNRPGSLQRVAIGLSLLGDVETGPMLSALLLKESTPEIQASIAAAMGWVKDPRPLRELCERLGDPEQNDLSRAWTAVAVGRICDPSDLPWNARLSVGINYDVALTTLVDPDARTGILDLP